MNSRKSTKIVFFVARHSRSGVPLAQMRLAKALARQGCSVDFVVGFLPDGLELPAAEGIRVVTLNKRRAVGMLGAIYQYLREVRPDVVFSAEDHLNFVVTFAMLLARSGAKLSVSSRVTPYDTYSNRVFSKKWIMKKLSIPLGRRADALVCVSKDMVKQYVAIFGPGPYRCIYNVVCDAESRLKMHEPVVDELWLMSRTVPVVISAGRLAPEKGFADLILAIGRVRRSTPVRLVILGEGPLHRELSELITTEGLDDCVKLIGFRDNPHKYFSKADVFVLSSYVEGLPNVLVEAMECGCTPVSTDCPTGPSEVLAQGKYGYLVPVRDPEAMAAGILRALEHPVSQELLDEAIRPFREDAVVMAHRSALGF
jgi:glycosyltransferase involved in cell wall biosynthesis